MPSVCHHCILNAVCVTSLRKPQGDHNDNTLYQPCRHKKTVSLLCVHDLVSSFCLFVSGCTIKQEQLNAWHSELTQH